MSEKVASNVSVIEKTDGPTSYFLIGDKQKKTVKQKIQKCIYNLRKSMVERHIKAAAHSIGEVGNYIKDVYGFVEINQSTEEFQTEYKQMRASCIVMYAPELLGTLASYPELAGDDTKDIKNFMEQMELRRKAAENIPLELFDIDLHIFEKKETDLQMRFIMESKYDYIGASASGSSKLMMKKYRKIYRSIYRYYGVTQADIDKKTSRYK
ncbi:MAG: hypothetical protein K2K20_06800 [Lachnospiraceae bacterium]|nr:hypothetical protein [Lachnospiraceae bacterium]